MTPPLATGKLPVFVVRTGRPALEIIKVDKEREANGEQSSKDAEFQEFVPPESCKEAYNSKIIGKLNGKLTDLEGGQSTAEIFEERIVEIDKDLKRYDQAITPDAKNIGDNGKENFLEFLSLTDDQPVYTQPSRAQQPPILMPLSRAPLSVIDENNVQKFQRGATWKRLNKTKVRLDIVMEDIVGGKKRV